MHTEGNNAKCDYRERLIHCILAKYHSSIHSLLLPLLWVAYVPCKSLLSAPFFIWSCRFEPVLDQHVRLGIPRLNVHCCHRLGVFHVVWVFSPSASVTKWIVSLPRLRRYTTAALVKMACHWWTLSPHTDTSVHSQTLKDISRGTRYIIVLC